MGKEELAALNWLAAAVRTLQTRVKTLEDCAIPGACEPKVEEEKTRKQVHEDMGQRQVGHEKRSATDEKEDVEKLEDADLRRSEARVVKNEEETTRETVVGTKEFQWNAGALVFTPRTDTGMAEGEERWRRWKEKAAREKQAAREKRRLQTVPEVQMVDWNAEGTPWVATPARAASVRSTAAGSAAAPVRRDPPWPDGTARTDKRRLEDEDSSDCESELDEEDWGDLADERQAQLDRDKEVGGAGAPFALTEIDEDILRAKIRTILSGITDLSTLTVGSMRAALEEALGQPPGALDKWKARVTEIARPEIIEHQIAQMASSQ